VLPLLTQSAAVASLELPSMLIISVPVKEDSIKMLASVMPALIDVEIVRMQMSALPVLIILLVISMTTVTV